MSERPDSGGARSLWGALTLLGGALLSVQSRMNGELSVVFGHSLTAALWSFGSGFVLLTVGLAVSSSMRGGLRSLLAALRHNELRWFQCLGGLLGAVLVAAQSYSVPLVGVALFTIATVGGQTLSGVLVDRLGVGPAGPVAVTTGRVVSAGLAVVGVAVAVGGRISGASTDVVLPVVLCIVAGMLAAVQQGLNGRVNVATRVPLSTTWLNFAFGTVLLLVLAIPTALGGSGALPVSADAPWWAWWGGLLGILIVAITAVAVRYLGILLVLLLMLVGQLAMAVVLDAANPATRNLVTPVVLVGLVVTLAAATLAALSAGRGRRHTGS